jgi:hypothetical protein
MRAGEDRTPSEDPAIDLGSAVALHGMTLAS